MAALHRLTRVVQVSQCRCLLQLPCPDYPSMRGYLSRLVVCRLRDKCSLCVCVKCVCVSLEGATHATSAGTRICDPNKCEANGYDGG